MTIKPPPPPPSPAKPWEPGYQKPEQNLTLADVMGRPRKFEGPEELWQAFRDYYTWAEANPLQEEVHTFYKGAPCRTKVTKMRAMTWQGFAVHAGLGYNTLRHMEKTREDLQEVFDCIRSVMFDQKFTGAAAGLLKEGIISRELGLADKKEVSGPNAGPVSFTIEPVKSGTFLPPTEAENALHPSATNVCGV